MLRITLLEMPATWGEPERALGDVADVLARGPATDLVLLPEQSLNGYVSPELTFDLAPFAEPLDGPTRERVAAIARRQRAMIVAPLVLREGEAIYNAVIGIDREGECAFIYRKYHPWHPERWATPGPAAPSITRISGVSLLTAVCYDLHFLEDDAAAALEAADVLLFPSAWVDPDDDRHIVLPALAARRELVVANANWAEGIVRAPGQGGSAIYDARGQTLARAMPAARPSIVRVDATLELQSRARGMSAKRHAQCTFDRMAKSATELKRVLVTGATGSMGAEVVRALVARGLPVRAVDLAPARVRALHGESVEAGLLDYHDGATWEAALAGCSSLFLVRPSLVDHMESTILPFLDAALAQGIQHVVFLSVIGAERNKQVPHHAIERHLADKNASYTLLRPGFFAQNLGLAYRADIAEDGRLFLPAGRGRVAFVDVRDVAEVAALVLAEPDAHRGAAYTCTGSEALSFEETARLMTDVTHRPIRYEAASVGGYVRHLHVRGMPLAQISVQTVLHVGLRSGQLEIIDSKLAELLGRAPRTLAAYVRENAELWSVPSSRRTETTYATAE